ncbi:MAG TPA: TfoX/Sxy family protein [Thermoanaerobaculia bacterium]|nr:TfoX/Sxy family protein [Thermoanaerobaculia bacterium]
MPKTDDFCEYVVEQLAPLGAARYRAMFGGFALYLDDMVVAIVDDGRLMLRADEVNRGDYEARGIWPFCPDPGKMGTMPYYEVPADVFESEDFLVWAERSRAAALRAKAAKEQKEREKEERRRKKAKA